MAEETLKERIAAHALAAGFDLVGIAPVEPPPHGEAFADWLEHGRHGEMAYLPRTAEHRLHPEQVVPWARSVVCVGLNYNTPHQRTSSFSPRLLKKAQMQGGVRGEARGVLTGTSQRRASAPTQQMGLFQQPARGWISRYAWGDDYHDAMQARLEQLLASVREEVGPEVQGQAFVDTGPVMDRGAAARAGLGWFGKNTNLLSPRLGSFFVLGELFLSLALEPDQPMADRCGQCRACLDACPTQAFVEPYVLDARRCISYLTIELKGAIPRALRTPVGTHVFGCDICQDVCPYNVRYRPTADPAFQPRPGLFEPELIPLLRLTDAEFKAKFRGSPILRAKRRGFLRNVCVALGNLGRAEAVPALAEALARDPEPLVRAHAAWALGRIGGPEADAALEEALVRERDTEVAEEIRLAREAAVGGPGRILGT